MRRLAENLPENGKAAARTAIVQEAIAKSGIENISVERFVNALERLNSADRRLLPKGRPLRRHLALSVR